MIQTTKTFRVICDSCGKPVHSLSVTSATDAEFLARKQHWEIVQRWEIVHGEKTDATTHTCPYCVQARDAVAAGTRITNCLLCGPGKVCEIPTHLSYARIIEETRKGRRISG